MGAASQEQNNGPTRTEMKKENSDEKHVQFKGLEPGPVQMASEKGSKMESMTIWSDTVSQNKKTC